MIDLVNYQTTVKGDRIFLKVLTEEDATQSYCGWLNDPIVNKYLETRQSTIDDLKVYINDKLISKETIFFGIFWKENNKHIGNLKLEPIDFKKNYATIGIILGVKEYWGKGIATEAVNLATEFCFNVLDLQEMLLDVIPENKIAVHVYLKCGYEPYKLNRGELDHDDVVYDNLYLKKVRLDK